MLSLIGVLLIVLLLFALTYRYPSFGVAMCCLVAVDALLRRAAR